MYLDEEYKSANSDNDKSLQDDYLAALCVAMMFTHIGA